MNLFSTALKWFFMGGLGNKETGPQVNTTGSDSTLTGSSVTDEKALKLSAVWDCVQMITNSVSSLPLNFYEKDGENKKIVTRHQLVDLLHGRPNSLMKPRDFRKAMTFQMAMWQNAYAEITWNDAGTRPLAIMPLRPGRMTPYIGNDGQLTYHYSTDKGIKVFAKKSILHLKGFGPDGISGLDRTAYARECLGLAVASNVYAAKQFANGGRSGGGYLLLDKFLKEEQRELFKKKYEGMSVTADNANKIWLLEGGMQYQPDTVNPDVMQMIETRKMNIAEIARFWGVPGALIGAPEGGSSSWPASFEQQMLSFLTFTLQDYIDEWEAGIQYALLDSNDRRSILVDHDVTGFIKMDSKTKAVFLSSLVQNGLMTRNEGRAKLGLPKSSQSGSDDLTVQVNLTLVDQLEKLGEENGGNDDESSTPIN